MKINSIVKKKMKDKIPLTNSEIAEYFNIEEKIVRNIFIMYENFGRESIISTILSDNKIDEIIKLKYPYINNIKM